MHDLMERLTFILPLDYNNLNKFYLKFHHRTPKKPKSNVGAFPKENRSWEWGETTFLVDLKYKYISLIEQNMCIVVCCAYHKEKLKKLAIYKGINAFKDLINAKRLVREIKLLKFFNHENFVSK